MKPELLAVTPVVAELADALDEAFVVHRLWEASDPDSLFAEVAGRIRGVVTAAGTGASAQLMDALPKLEIVSSFGVGADRLDLEHAARKGVIVTTTPDVLNDDVADLTMALMLASSRRICEADRFVRAGRWPDGPFGLGRKVHGRRLGILGLGRIGREIALRAEAFRMPIAYHQRTPDPAQPYQYYPTLLELAKNSDFLVAIVPGGASTRHLVNREVMDALGPEGTLINVARGSVVDEEALVDALSAGTLGAAALDVYEKEPQVPEALMAMDNVVLLPHLGSATTDTRGAMGRLVIDNLHAHFSGKPPLTAVTA